MSDNFKGVLKQANNDVTGDAIRTGKGSPSAYASGYEKLFGKPEPKQRYVGMNYKAECSPYLTMCPRCNNPHNGCDQVAQRAKAYADATYDEFQERAAAAMQRLPEYLKGYNSYD